MMHKGSSLNKRINVLLVVCFVPLTIVAVYLLSLVLRFSERYDAIVSNITQANEYNISFKEDVDYTMYVIVANSERAEELVDTELPNRLITQARRAFEGLAEEADGDYAKNQLARIVKSLDTLEDRVTEIKQDAQISGMYDKNMERLDLDIRILTQLIQEQIQEYIYHEATNLEALRAGVRADVALAVRLSILIIAVVLVGALVLGRKITRHLTSGIQQLRTVTKKAGHGDFTVRAGLEDSDEELAELGEGFNQMVERIGNLVEDIRVEQLNLRSMELKLLQAQINPHFLYNTLDTIVWLAEANQTEQVVMMVTALSDFFRTTLSKGRDYITVQEEESHIRSYLKIQQFRYQDILDYEIDIPEEMHHYQILKLTLQPLVENALYHGIKNKRGKGRILVTGYLESGRMVFLVQDNGQGMTGERLAQVQREMNKNETDTGDPSGFGLFNVVQRIKLNYGAQYGIWISSTFMEGTEVRVELPAIKN
ncbi:HAMP domain protein [Marvinbryantia formatexigens DSM 14469]|uniref:HAMP domain protein n=1 Tax=Marvinbryantia formatexigens DSM 14469 TaxID=478749 RepID=C6LHP8_9FIRM|nr:histidine kinase [Marvinbryantia formatexigens]EET59788.1 HAMP domain protein [Marvinbryantia formatexigens DSM 14469]UWO23337.1 histidine kinase [Marvinbryantia formatexigens DSM 14469]SDG40999.1 two-component system, sensor histidine kinase YesM [Marvinbryantia formatexigens]